MYLCPEIPDICAINIHVTVWLMAQGQGTNLGITLSARSHFCSFPLLFSQRFYLLLSGPKYMTCSSLLNNVVIRYMRCMVG